MRMCARCAQIFPDEQFKRKRGTGYVLLCLACRSRQAKHIQVWRDKNPDQFKEGQSAYYDPARRREYNLKKQYGLTRTQYDEMVALRKGLCDLCGKPWNKPHVDHCHVGGYVRGLLCATCNQGLGKLGDTIEGLERALAYLKRAEATHLDSCDA